MSLTYTIKDQNGQYFITWTVQQWVDVFTREVYKEILLNSIRYCQQMKGLQVYGWVLMSNYIHPEESGQAIIVSSSKEKLSDNIRDFKKFTATKVIEAIRSNAAESRRNWMLWPLMKEEQILLFHMFCKACRTKR